VHQPGRSPRSCRVAAGRSDLPLRETDAQRRELLERALEGAGIVGDDLDEIVRLTGARDGRGYGCTFSDLRQRFIVDAVLDALDRGPLQAERLVELASAFVPTPPFGESNA
jgi:hypothetical protein